MVSKSKYGEKITKEAESLLMSINGGIINTPRLSKFLKEIAGEKPKKLDHKTILQSRIK